MKYVYSLLTLLVFSAISCNKDQTQPQESTIVANDNSASKTTATVDFSLAGAVVTKDDAAKMTNNFQFEIAGVRSHTFNKDVLLKLLGQPNVVAVRFYHGVENSQPVLVVVGVDKGGFDTGIYLERSYPCPPYCGINVYTK